jgi:hypothetical protein
LSASPPDKKTRLDEYEYRVEAQALETFTNLMRFQGVSMPWGGPANGIIVFTSDRLLNMRRLKERGIIKSYTIIRLTRRDEVIEEG